LVRIQVRPLVFSRSFPAKSLLGKPNIKISIFIGWAVFNFFLGRSEWFSEHVDKFSGWAIDSKIHFPITQPFSPGQEGWVMVEIKG
jgi:hypothetical protein